MPLVQEKGKKGVLGVGLAGGACSRMAKARSLEGQSLLKRAASPRTQPLGFETGNVSISQDSCPREALLTAIASKL